MKHFGMKASTRILHERARRTAARWRAAGANPDRVNRYCGRAEVIITRHAARLGDPIPTLYVHFEPGVSPCGVPTASLDRHTLVTWPGNRIAPLEVTGTANGFNGAKLYCYSATIEGRRYYGRGLGPGMYLNLRPAAR